MIIDIERLKSKLSYDPNSGELKWLSQDRLAGCKDVRYIKVRVDRKLCYAHRLAWAIYYNEQPPQIIDHINGNGFDNRICNLRAATQSQNSRNSKTPKKKTCKLKGVTLDKFTNSYKASISINGKAKHIGRFKTEKDAHLAYVYAAKKRDSEFYRAE